MAVTAPKGVIASATNDDVSAVVAMDEVRAITAKETVFACQTHDLVVTVSTVKNE